MAATAVIETQIDEDVRREASEVLARMGLTISDVLRTVLTRTARDKALPAGLEATPEEYDAWFRAKVQEAMDDPRPRIPAEEVERHFAERRAGAMRKAS